jgi:hypothetical protein
VSSADDLATLAAEFAGWHIWRSRAASGTEVGWRATRKKRRPGHVCRLAAADAAACVSSWPSRRHW